MQNTGRISDKFAVTHHLKDVGVFSTEIKPFAELEGNYGKEKRIFISIAFVTLCCGILTLKTSDLFFRSFRFSRQNETFSATEQNQTYKNSLFLEISIQFS